MPVRRQVSLPSGRSPLPLTAATFEGAGTGGGIAVVTGGPPFWTAGPDFSTAAASVFSKFSGLGFRILLPSPAFSGFLTLETPWVRFSGSCELMPRSRSLAPSLGRFFFLIPSAVKGTGHRS